MSAAVAPAVPVGPRAIQPVTPPARGRYGNALTLRDDPLGTLVDWQAKYGGVVRVRLKRWTNVLYEPDDVKHVLVSHQGRYHKGANLRTAVSVFGNGLLTSEAPFHLEQRHLMQPAFHREVLQSYASTMVERTDRWVGALAGPTVVDVHPAMMRVTLEIAAQTMFGLDDVAEAEPLSQAIEVAQETFRRRIVSLFPPPEWFPSPTNLRAWKALDVMDALVLRVIRERRASSGPRNDLLTFLLRAQDDEGHGMDDAQLRDEALTLLLAGHETTASGLSWALYLLALHPQVQDRARQEVTEVLGGSVPGPSDVPKLSFVDRVFSEAIRLYPPAWVLTRQAMEPDVLETGVSVSAGEEVMFSPWAFHRNPRFFPDPERFDPERFLPAVQKSRPAFAYFPFGGGSRRCIGEPFAKMEAVLVLARVLSQLTLRPSSRPPPVPDPLFTLRPRGGVFIDVEPRAAHAG